MCYWHVHADIYSQNKSILNYTSNVPMCLYTQKVRIRRRKKKISNKSFLSYGSSCFPGDVRNFWLNQIFTDCHIWRKTEHYHLRLTISSHPAESQYIIKYYFSRNETLGRKDIVWCHASFPGMRTGFPYYPQVIKS